jgi:chitodextrinase
LVEARDAAGNVSYSPLAKLTLEDNTPPKWPEGAELTVLDVKETSVELAWPEATDDYEVMYHLLVNGKEYAYLSQNPYTITGLLPGTEYTFTVYATDGTQENEELSFKVTTPDKTAPTWETGSNISASNITETSLDLSWPSAKDNVGVTGYRIKQNGNVLQTLDNTAMSYKVTGLHA